VTVAAGDFDYIADLLRRRTAIVLEPGKEYLVESRLLPVARQAGAGSVSDLVALLQRAEDDALHGAVVDAMTTNETSWFRDRHPFDAFAASVLPDLLARRATERRLAIWSAGCSTGQEPYSIAMTLSEQLAGRAGWQVEVLATDVAQDVLARAAAGRYGQLEVNRGLPAARLVKHFDREGMEWVVRPHVRRYVRFASVNLAEPLPAWLPRFDVVFLRNVLIYFDTATKRDVLRRIRSVLRPDGYLFLGGAETALNLDDAFEPTQLDRATCYRLRDAGATP
jgi:chemotaxis protein methyltransferase CheR